MYEEMTPEELQAAHYKAETPEEANNIRSEIIWRRLNDPEAVSGMVDFINGGENG